jgi:hypothetical protein
MKSMGPNGFHGSWNQWMPLEPSSSIESNTPKSWQSHPLNSCPPHTFDRKLELKHLAAVANNDIIEQQIKFGYYTREKLSDDVIAG